MKVKLSKSQWEEIGKKSGWTKLAQVAQEESFIPKEVQEIAAHIPTVNLGTKVISVGKASPSQSSDGYKIVFSCTGLTQTFCKYIGSLGIDCAIYIADGNFVLFVWFNR